MAAEKHGNGSQANKRECEERRDRIRIRRGRSAKVRTDQCSGLSNLGHGNGGPHSVTCPLTLDQNGSLVAAPSARHALLSVLFPSTDQPDLALRVPRVPSLSQLSDCTESHCISIASDPERSPSSLGSYSIPPRSRSGSIQPPLIEATVTSTRTLELGAQVSGVDGVFEGVVALLRDAGDATNVEPNALFALCQVKQTRNLAMAAGAREALVDRLADCSAGADAERELATVELLCREQQGCAVFDNHS